MFSDPQTVTMPTAGAKAMPRVATANYSALYRKSDGLFTLAISHQLVNKRNRSLVRFTQYKVAADQFDTTINVEYSTSVDIKIDRPVAGFTDAEVIDIAAGIFAWATASSNANLTKVVGLES